MHLGQPAASEHEHREWFPTDVSSDQLRLRAVVLLPFLRVGFFEGRPYADQQRLGTGRAAIP